VEKSAGQRDTRHIWMFRRTTRLTCAKKAVLKKGRPRISKRVVAASIQTISEAAAAGLVLAAGVSLVSARSQWLEPAEFDLQEFHPDYR